MRWDNPPLAEPVREQKNLSPDTARYYNTGLRFPLVGGGMRVETAERPVASNASRMVARRWYDRPLVCPHCVVPDNTLPAANQLQRHQF